ncbi:hypothetical protein RN22_24265, partial [Grimontia sp. AD028]
TDVAGNISQSSTAAGFTLDTTAAGEGTGAGGTDEAPVLTIAEATDGVSEAEASDGVQVSVAVPTGTVAGDTITLTVTQPDGTTETVDTLVPSDWNGTDPIVMTVSTDILSDTDGFVDGDYSVTATVTDVAGNVSEASTPSDFTLDTTAAGEGTGAGGTDEAPVLTIAEATDGVSETEASDGVQVSVAVPTGTVSGDTITLTVTQPDGTTETVETLISSDWNGTDPIVMTVPTDILSDTDGFVDGDYSVTATVTDVAGNVSKASTPSDFTLDTTAAGEGTGAGGTDEAPVLIIAEATDGVSEAEANDGVQVSVAVPTGTVSGDTITLTVTQPDGSTETVDTLIPSDWNGTDPLVMTVPTDILSDTDGFVDGDYSVTATVTDVAGNVSQSSNTSSFNLDTTAAGEGTGAGGTDEAPVLTIAEATDGVSEAEASDGVQVSVAVPTGTVSGDTITLTVTQPDGTTETVNTLIPS